MPIKYLKMRYYTCPELLLLQNMLPMKAHLCFILSVWMLKGSRIPGVCNLCNMKNPGFTSATWKRLGSLSISGDYPTYHMVDEVESLLLCWGKSCGWGLGPGTLLRVTSGPFCMKGVTRTNAGPAAGLFSWEAHKVPNWTGIYPSLIDLHVSSAHVWCNSKEKNVPLAWCEVGGWSLWTLTRGKWGKNNTRPCLKI